DGRIEQLEIREPGELTLQDAQAIARWYIPGDSELIETYVPADQDYLTVDLFVSESLAEVFDETWWFGSDPGTFIIDYALFEDGSSMIIGTGNNP
ncbi:MAG: hypothetical protein ACP5JG_00495, partial [Anaerolineae bacterium]